MFRNKDISHFINVDPEEKGFKVSTPVRFRHAFRGRMAIIKAKIKANFHQNQNKHHSSKVFVIFFKQTYSINYNILKIFSQQVKRIIHIITRGQIFHLQLMKK